MSIESFFTTTFEIWHFAVWIIVANSLRVGVTYAWKRGKRDGRKEYDEYKKWEKRFKDEGGLPK